MASYGKGAQLEGTALEWLNDVRTLEDRGIRRTGAILAVSANEMLGRLEGSYKRLIDSRGADYRYTTQQQAARVNAIADKAGDFINPSTRRQIIDLQKQDLVRAQQMGNRAGLDLEAIINDRSKTLEQNAKPNMRAIDAAGKRLGDFWSRENTAFRDRVRALTQVGAAQGLSYRKLANQVRELLLLERAQGTESDRSKAVNKKLGIQNRAELIARTEIQTAYVQGQIDQARRNEFAWGRWSAGGERTCGFCISRHGMIYELDDIEGQIPAHPRCRCTVIPVEAPDGWKKGDKVDPKTTELDDEFWTGARERQIKEWKRDQNTNRRGERKAPELLKSSSELDDALRRYLNTPTNTQQYLMPGSNAPAPLWKPSGNTIPDPAAAAANAAAAAEAQAAAQAAADLAKAQAQVKERPDEGETFRQHSNANGAEPDQNTIWTAERAKLHDDILNHFLKDGVKSKNPTFTMSGGGPASGKGFMLKKTGLDQPGKVVLDADEIKKLIPEYAKAQKEGGAAQQKAASRVHEESSYLAKKLMAAAAERGFDVVLDGTGDNGYKSLKKKVDKMRAAGYRVEAKYVSADTDLAAQRNWDRFLKTGRLPPEHMLRNVHRDVSRTLPEAMDKDLFDAVELYDTNKSGELRLVVSKTQGQKAKIKDQQLWDDFLRKGEAETWTAEQGEKAIAQRKLKEDPAQPDTASRYSNARGQGAEPNPDSVWTADRKKLHDDIVAHFLKNGKVSDNPTFTMSGGGPASGKGFMLKKTGLDQPGKVVIDADEIKKLIPEYGEMQKAGGKKALKAAAYVHEESSYLAKRIMGEAADAGFDVVLDGTGDNGLKSLKKKVDKMREKGYRVEAKYVSADTEVAVDRNWERFLKTGRLPPEHMLRNVHRDVSRTLPEAMEADLFDDVQLYDTNKSGELRLVVSQKQGQKPKIHDQQLWDDFKRKGDADVVSEADVKQMQERRQLKEDPKARDTLARHSNARDEGAEPGPDTVWTRERKKLHDEIVETFLKNGKKSDQPTFTMSGGGPASGKGFMLKKTGLDQPGKVVVDSDEIKKLLPEYVEMQKAGGKKGLKAAAYVHEESSYLAKRIMSEAADAGFDVVLDGTGDNGVKSLKKKVDKMRAKGYRVEAKYVSAETEVAVQRNWDRFLKTGRLPPEHMLRNVHRDVSRTLPDAMDQGLFDKVELYDTNKSGELRLVASQDAPGRKPKIHDQKLWDDFKRKGDADVVSEADVARLQEARQLKEWKSAPETLARHSNARGKGAEPGPETVWTRERAKLHDEIIESFLAKGKVSADPTFTMSGGGPASGKGFMLKKTGLDQPGKVVVDSDEIKKLLPEYQEMQKAGGAKAKKAAGYVHEESSYLAKRIMDAAADRGFDVILDGTGDNGLKSLAKKVDKMRAKGYKVEAKYVSADTEVAAERNWERFLKTGRLPPESMLRNVHRDVSRTLPDAIDADLFDRVELYDTNKTGELRKVISKTKGEKATTHDDALWQRFLKKADAETFTPADDARLIKAQEQRMPTLDAKPAAPKAAVKPKAPKPPADRDLTEMLGRSGRVDTDLVQADPERFQYKVNANKTTGEVGSLKGASKWNEELAGVMSVWRDPANDQLYVINGHNRLALAKRMGVKEIPVLQIKAKTAQEARMIGAKQNIASGDGTAIDAAKFMRDSGLKAADLQRVGMNLKAKVARDGAALANLPDHVFTAAVEGRLPLDKAVALGRSGLEPAQMADAYKILKDRPTMPTAQVDALMAAARASTTRTKREQTLFGETAEQVTTMVEQAKVAANVKADLKKQVSVLEKAARNAEALKAKGNRIDVNKAELKAANARAQLDVFDAQVFRPGSKVNQALTKGAAGVQDASGRGGVQKASKAAKDSVLDALGAEVKAMQTQPGGVLRGVADLNAAEAGRRARPPELELAGRPDLTTADIPARLIDPAKAKPGSMGGLRPDQIAVDADRFQYKATSEKSGEVGSLEGVQRFDRNLAGVISVWKDPANGQTYVINGHNRLAAAKRLGADAVEVRYINAKDASEARSVGAMANIAEGHGTAIDAAKWMRETGLGGDGLRGLGMAMKKDVAVQGAALANLPDDLWQQVVNETISPEKAAAIGGGGLDAQGMANVAKVLKHRPNASVETVRELVAAEKASMEMGTTGSLFGEDSAAYQMERAQLTRDMRRDILSDKQLFNTLASNRAKAELESAGSTLDVDANARAAAEQDAVLSVYDQLKNNSGPVADALSRGARAMEGASSAADKLRIRKQVRDEIGDAVREELQGLVPGQTEAPPEAPGQESLF